MKASAAELAARIQKAIDLAKDSMATEGGHHIQWYVDQIVRALAADDYEKIVEDATKGDGRWEEDVAP